MVGRLVRVALGLGAALFAVQGGEYGTTDLLEQRARRRALVAQIDSLAAQVDSLAALKRRLAGDAALQERIAREEYGMVRGEKELLYWLGDAPARPSPRPSAAGR